ncbi:MBL fold metallo-hydrolase [archaeon SCG-AAA382B04]|nr:MBL fold metallo-hydrolase [archaeon SCG-AAA382B04]
MIFLFMKLTFLGTGGGRFTTIFQKRNTGGIRLDNEKNHIHLDPGPGALLLSKRNGLDPKKLNSLILTHSHPDHYNDLEVLIEAMTKGGTQKTGKVLTSESGIKKMDEYGPTLSDYHKDLPREIISLNNNSKIPLKDQSKVIPVPAKHSDPSTRGLILETKKGNIGFTSDTEYFEELGQIFSDTRLLIMNVTRPKAASIPYHLSTDDAIQLLEEVDPEVSVITHFGMKMLNQGVEEQVKIIREETNQKCIAAEDGMKIEFDRTINFQDKQDKLTNY